MERETLINEMCWEYNYSKKKASTIVDEYKNRDKYQDLCELVKARQEISMIIKEDV